MMAGCPGQDAAKQTQAMILPPPSFTDGIKLLSWNAVCSHNIIAYIISTIKYICFIHPLNFSPIVLWLVHMIFNKQFSFWRTVAFFLQLCHAHLLSVFLMVGSWTLTLAKVRKTFNCLEVTLGTFATSQTITRSALEWSLLVDHFSGR